MKKRLLLITAIVCIIGIGCMYGTTTKNDVVDFITSVFSPRQFTAGVVSPEAINQILTAGHKAPSAVNRQPWHFTVVRNKALIDRMINNVNDGEVLIVISAPPKEVSRWGEFDSALATQNMFLTAQALGFASRIYANPVQNINDNLHTSLQIPDTHQAVMVLRIGHLAAGVDATTAASPRAALETKVNYIN